jgi:hypothetical protein
MNTLEKKQKGLLFHNFYVRDCFVTIYSFNGYKFIRVT